MAGKGTQEPTTCRKCGGPATQYSYPGYASRPIYCPTCGGGGATRPTCPHGKDRRRDCHKCKRTPARIAAQTRANARQHSAAREVLSALVNTTTCAICAVPFGNTKATTWHIDHDHASDCHPGTQRSGPTQDRYCYQCIRGALCSQCNTALGLVNDDPHILIRMLAYLQGTHHNDHPPLRTPPPTLVAPCDNQLQLGLGL